MDGKFVFPSREWVEEYCRRLSSSEEYNKTGQGWKDPILFKVIDAEEKNIVPGSFILYLKDGKCEKCEIIEKGEKDAPFVLSATFANWQKIIDGKINPTQAMLTGQMKVKGNMALLLRYASAATAMVKVAQTIPTEYIKV